jgi:hypothetical protein
MLQLMQSGVQGCKTTSSLIEGTGQVYLYTTIPPSIPRKKGKSSPSGVALVLSSFLYVWLLSHALILKACPLPTWL